VLQPTSSTLMPGLSRHELSAAPARVAHPHVDLGGVLDLLPDVGDLARGIFQHQGG
jgi:hypothetical protein